MNKKMLTGLAFILAMGAPHLSAQRSKDIHVNAALVTDLQAAAANLELDGAVIVGDTITIDDSLEMRALSLFLYCNQLRMGNKMITIYPNNTDSSTFSADGKGLLGRNVTVYSAAPVSGGFVLPGGAGRPGKKGGDGKDGVKPTVANCCGAVNRGAAGRDGAAGSAGGNGGNLSIMSLAEKNQTHATISGDGGAGGAGGKGGTGGTTYKKKTQRPREDLDNPSDPGIYNVTHEKDGKPGAAGANGVAATSVVTKIVRQAFNDGLHRYGVDSLGGAQVAFTTLISLTPRPLHPGTNDPNVDRNTERETR